jgi:hypothetical protein
MVRLLFTGDNYVDGVRRIPVIAGLARNLDARPKRWIAAPTYVGSQ